MAENNGPGRPAIPKEKKRKKTSGPSLRPIVYELLEEEAKSKHQKVAAMIDWILEERYKDRIEELEEKNNKILNKQYPTA